MTFTDSPALAGDLHARTNPIWLFKAEIMKIRTTRTWWLSLIGIVVITGWALLRNGVNNHYLLNPPLSGLNAHDRAQALTQAAQAHTYAGHAAIAADMMTSGQLLGVLFAMLLGTLIVTNETYHQTATATYLANPRRGRVIAAKFAAATAVAALFWLVSTTINLVTTSIYLQSLHINISLLDWIPVRSTLLNLLAYTMWAVFGLGLGTLVHHQVAAVITGMAAYLAGTAVVLIIANLIYLGYHHAWILSTPVIAPAVASLIMTTPGRAFDHAPAQWAGLLVMAGYTLTFAAIGTTLTRRRDIA
jgi:ABC-type transport system involved in multi-copper enzyme maturation permease subunit